MITCPDSKLIILEGDELLLLGWSSGSGNGFDSVGSAASMTIRD